MRGHRRAVAAVIVIAALVWTGGAGAQEIEPRTYANAPVGVNFLAVVYGYSAGNVLLDPSLPIAGLDANLHVFAARYVRTLDTFGVTSKLRVIVPATFGDWRGALAGVPRERKIDGVGDLRLGLTSNIVGSPALSRSEFASHEPEAIVGIGVELIAPTGQYDSARLINLSSNRWTFIPQLGASWARGSWSVEAAARAWLFGANDDFFGGNRLEQRPLFAVQLHGVYTWRPGLWLAVGVAASNGGRTVVNGNPRDTLQQNVRAAAVLAYPTSSSQGLRLTVATSLSTSTGADYRTLAVAYQISWGGRE